MFNNATQKFRIDNAEDFCNKKLSGMFNNGVIDETTCIFTLMAKRKWKLEPFFIDNKAPNILCERHS